jgi:hypothetical protein
VYKSQPFLGQGANQGIQDAVCLAGDLAMTMQGCLEACGCDSICLSIVNCDLVLKRYCM